MHCSTIYNNDKNKQEFKINRIFNTMKFHADRNKKEKWPIFKY